MCNRLARIGQFALILLIASFAFAEGTQTWRQTKFEEFEKGTAKGVAIRSDGALELGPERSRVGDQLGWGARAAGRLQQEHRALCQHAGPACRDALDGISAVFVGGEGHPRPEVRDRTDRREIVAAAELGLGVATDQTQQQSTLNSGHIPQGQTEGQALPQA